MAYVENARAAWGHDAPDWIIALAKECDRTSQNKTAQRIGYTAPAVNQVLRNKYKASTASIEESVRGQLMSEVVDCPQIGEIGRHDCKEWRRKMRQGVRVNRLHVQMSRACSKCPLHADDEG